MLAALAELRAYILIANKVALVRSRDLAFVRGEIVHEGRASKYVGGPLYRAFSVELNERVD